MAARSLSLREKRLIQAAVVLAIIVLISLLLRGGGGSTPAPDPVAPPISSPTGATYAGPPPQTYAGPPPAVPPSVAPPSVGTAPSAPPAGQATAVSQLKLFGLLASGAVIGYPNGGQRLVPVGREALPGLILVRVDQNHAVFQSGAAEVRLGFDGLAQPVPPAPAS